MRMDQIVWKHNVQEINTLYIWPQYTDQGKKTPKNRLCQVFGDLDGLVKVVENLLSCELLTCVFNFTVPLNIFFFRKILIALS